MLPQILVDLLGNLGIVFTVAALWSLTLDWRLHHKLPQALVVAPLAGAGAVLLMSFPIEVYPGVIFDLRAVPIVLSGVFGGPLVGLSVGLIAAGYRLALGGLGALPATAGMLLLTIIGVATGHSLRGRLPSTSTLILIGLAAAGTNMVGPLLLPAEIRWKILEQITLPAMSIVFVAVFFVGKMISNDLERRRVIEELRLSQERLSKANANLSELVNVDGLTGIANRRAFDEALTTEIKRAGRIVAPLSLVMIDVDNFKSFNDHYGHIAGDNCLRTIAAVTRSSLERSGDLLARFGGEELAILLPMTDADGAAAVAEKVRSAIAGLGLPHEGSSTGFVTVSIGVATMAGPQAIDPPTLTQQADEALYRAKRTGRNRVVACGAGDIRVPTPDKH